MPINRYTIYIAMACLALSPGCKKNSTNNKPPYNYPITGIAYIITDYNNNAVPIPLRNKPIFIDSTLSTDTISYFYSLTSGSDGSFTFYVTDTTRPYRIFTSCYDTSSAVFIPLYYGTLTTTHPYGANP